VAAPTDRFWAPPDLSQPEHGYHHTLDSWLLAAFAIALRPRHWCDLGTGSGAIAYALAHSLPNSRGVAIERQDLLSQHAHRNLCETGVILIRGDLRVFPWREACFDLLVCNPPYFAKDRGRLNREEERAAARHTLHGDIIAFARTTRFTLTDQGSFCFVYPTDRLDPVLERMTELGLYLHERLDIRSFAAKPAILTCVALRKEDGKSTESELVLYEAHRVWTEKAIEYLESIGFQMASG